jgi:hypothetical protein
MEVRMLRATLAVKVAASVVGAVLLTGGGIALAESSSTPQGHPSVTETESPDEPSPGAHPSGTCAPGEQDDHGQVGAQGQEGEDGHNASTAPRPSGSPEADDQNEQGNADDQGEDCDNDGTKGDDAHETEGPETEKSEGPDAETSGSNHEGDGGSDGSHTTPMPSGSHSNHD